MIEVPVLPLSKTIWEPKSQLPFSLHQFYFALLICLVKDMAILIAT